MKKAFKYIWRILIVALVSALIESFVFNIDYFIVKAKSDSRVNIVLKTEDFTVYNWDADNGKMVSMYDPILAVEDFNGYIDTIKIQLLVDGYLPYVDVYYSNEENPVMGEDTQFRLAELCEDGSYYVRVDKYVEELRIDLGDEAGLILDDISVLINENVFSFSLARFVTMNLIYWFAVLLFAAQRLPKYNI